MDKSEKLWYNLSDKDMTEEEKQKTALEIVNIVNASIEQPIQRAVQKHVNGKIDKVHIKLDEEKKERIIGDKTINEKLDSIVSVADWWRKFGKGLMYTGGLAGAILAILALVKYVT